MYVYVRLIKTIATSFFRSKKDPLACVKTPIMIWPADIDVYGHVNNGRYLTLMDLGRFDLTIRTGLHKVLFAKRWYPVVGSAHIQFRKSLHLGNRFTLESRIVGWDEKWFYLAQTFIYRDEVYARGLVRAVFLQGRKTVNPAEVAAALGMPPMSPPLSEWITSLQSADAAAASTEVIQAEGMP